MAGSCRKGGDYGGLTAFDVILNDIINKAENNIAETNSPGEFRFLEHKRNQKLIETIKTECLKNLVR